MQGQAGRAEVFEFQWFSAAADVCAWRAVRAALGVWCGDVAFLWVLQGDLWLSTGFCHPNHHFLPIFGSGSPAGPGGQSREGPVN